MAIKKITREQIASYLDVTPSETNPSWKVIGVGVTDYSISYNPQVTTEKWIINKNATSSLDSYQIQGDITQTCYKGDPVYDFINSLRRNEAVGANAEAHILDIDLYDETSGSYSAIMHNCTITVSSYGGSDNAQIEYNIYYNGDGEQGTVTISDGTVTFTKTASI